MYVRRYCQRMTNHQYRRNKKIQLRSLLTRDFSKDASICSQKHSTEATTAKTENKKTLYSKPYKRLQVLNMSLITTTKVTLLGSGSE